MSDDKFKRGLEIRKEVLGAEYVERALANADEFTMPLQQMVTEHAWHDIWSRPGLSRRDRSLVNLAMISALNRPHELKLHVAGKKFGHLAAAMNRTGFQALPGAEAAP